MRERLGLCPPAMREITTNRVASSSDEREMLASSSDEREITTNRFVFSSNEREMLASSSDERDVCILQ